MVTRLFGKVDINHGRGGRANIRGRGQMRKIPIMEEQYRSVYKAPMDVNGNMMSVPMKLEMVIKEDEEGNKKNANDRVNQLMRLYREEFMSAARLFGVEITSVDEMQLISEGCRCVSVFQMTCPNWPSSLTQFIEKFFAAIKSREITTDPHKNELAGVQFGSMIDIGQIGVHWLMNGGSRTETKIEKNGYTLDNKIFAIFDYDQKKIEIDYYNFETDLENEEKELCARGKITIDMKSIRRIFFDQNTDGDATKCSLVLQLEFPPKLSVQPFEITRDNYNHSRLHYLPSEPRTELQRGRVHGEISDRKALHDSKTVILEFEKSRGSPSLDSSVDISRLMAALLKDHSFRDLLNIGEDDGDESHRPIDDKIGAYYYDMVARLRHKTGRMIEFSSFNFIDMIEGQMRSSVDQGNGKVKVSAISEHTSPYFVDVVQRNEGAINVFDEKIKEFITKASEELVKNARTGFGVNNPEELQKIEVEEIQSKAFSLRAFLHGILDRGMEFRIELLRFRSRWYEFVETVSTIYSRDEKRTLHALERVMCAISEGRPTCSIPKLFEKEFDESTLERQMSVFSEKERQEGYRRIMKLMVTPTRIIFVGYEISMGNRILNKYAKGENHIIRLAFRDDSGEQFHTWNYSNAIRERFKQFLVEGITYAGRTFHWLGNSNSQLSEQGCYMIHVNSGCRFMPRTPQEIHRQMGKFDDLPNIPKMLARIGLLFTQSKRSEQPISSDEVGVTHDFNGGRNSKGKSHTFSDGVGCISEKYATLLSKEHRTGAIASAYQIRFRGEKGMLCIDPLIDKKNAVKKMMGIGEEKKVLVRPSMTKFQVADDMDSHLEIVKLSSSYSAVLNRPLMNILCQVSAHQSGECHQRIRKRVMELMHSMARDSMEALYVEEKAIKAIMEMSFPFMMEVFASSSGFQLTTEPFFRSLLLSNCKYVIRKRMGKMNIKLPSSKSCVMFGVVDTTGILQYGQIFCQHSGNVGKQTKGDRGSGTVLLEGPIMITKNPCVSAGDVRMFEAIDIPALRHLVDVIVFPMHGPRPHPDEMAGSDLDGDEYMVIWDEEMLLERSEEASVFPSGEEQTIWAIPKKWTGEVDYEKCEERKADFFTEAIVLLQPGMMCIAHLAVSDLYGLESKVAKALATKISLGLDYQKTGIKPEEMINEVAEDPDDPKRVIPPENSKRKPDFLASHRKAGYESTGIVGEVFRETTKYEHSLDCLEEQKKVVELDPTFSIPGWEKYKKSVEEELANYSYKMKSLLMRFGISTEEELLSGMILSMKNKFSEKEEVKGTFFTTNRVIEEKVKSIIEQSREKFFEPLSDWRYEMDEVKSARNDLNPESILLRRVNPNMENIEEIRKKASAAYCIAYESAKLSVKRGEQCAILLSFPWIVYDVLLDIKTPNSIVLVEEENKRSDIHKNISDFIDRYSEDPSNSGRFADFMKRFFNAHSIVAQSMMENEGLARTSFVLIEWANQVGAVGRGFREEHLLALFVIFGFGLMNTRGQRMIRLPDGYSKEHQKKGEHLLLFLDYVSSMDFRNRPWLSFDEVGEGVLMRGEWRRLSESALSCFLSLVTTLRLPIDRESAATASLREYEPRIVELTGKGIEDLDGLRDALRRVSGCTEVRLRRTDPRRNFRMILVSAIGTSEQLRILTSFIYPPAPSREESTVKGKVQALRKFTVFRLLKAAQESNAL